jgi:hypothetical protein
VGGGAYGGLTHGYTIQAATLHFYGYAVLCHTMVRAELFCSKVWGLCFPPIISHCAEGVCLKYSAHIGRPEAVPVRNPTVRP